LPVQGSDTAPLMLLLHSHTFLQAPPLWAQVAAKAGTVGAKTNPRDRPMNHRRTMNEALTCRCDG
jgi:hypothetical protein